MVPRETVLVVMPAYDRRIDIGCFGGLIACLPFYERPFFLVGMSNISLARNELAHIFMEKSPIKYDWMMMIDSDIVFTTADWLLLWEGDEDIVTADYSKKIIGERPVSFGLGFTRVHRRVLEKIKDLKKEDGTEYAQRFYHKGEMMINYFPNGANPDGRWLSEDHGFFVLASLTDVKPRVEKRTRLLHVGSFEYGYPDQLPVGYQKVDLDEGEVDLDEGAN
jgi:hypothetical protein